jgi:PAS domain S-box-containing protein
MTKPRLIGHLKPVPLISSLSLFIHQYCCAAFVVSSKLVGQRNALREREKQYRSVVENVKEVIFQTDTAGNWIFLNPAWTTVTGFTVAESLGTNVLNYVHPDDWQLHQELLRALIAGEKASCRHEIRYLTKAGECRWVEIHANSIRIANDVVTGISGILQDITSAYLQKL